MQRSVCDHEALGQAGILGSRPAPFIESGISVAEAWPRALRRSLTALALVIALSGSCLAESVTVAIDQSTIPASVAPGFSGTFELELINPASNSSSFDVAGFQFELRVPDASGVLFTNATTATSASTYIFSGNSVADSFFGGSLIVSPPPPPATSDLLGFDTVLGPNTFTTLNPGDSVGLGLISFSVDPNASPGLVPISIISLDADNPSGTQLSDPNGNPISFATSDGSIVIGASSVPEPTSLVMALIGGAAVAFAARARRGRQQAVKTPSTHAPCEQASHTV